MSKKRVLLAVNTLTAVGSQPYASHLNLSFRIQQSGDDFVLFNGYRNSIDRFRNRAGQIALEGEFDYLMFLDDDILVAPDTYEKLKARMESEGPDGYIVDVVTPVVFIRSYPFKPMFFKGVDLRGQTGLEIYDDYESKCKEGDLLPVAAIGFSCCLLRVELLKNIQPAWFVTGSLHTEDVYFCIKAKQTYALKKENVGIYVDTALDSGHMMDSEFVSKGTVKALRNYYEELSPELKVRRTNGGDNSPIYLADNKAALAAAQAFEISPAALEVKVGDSLA